MDKIAKSPATFAGPNGHYLPDFAEQLIVFCKEFPCTTNVMNAHFQTEDETATSAYVESYFSQLKSSIVSANSRPRPDVFVAKHSQQIDRQMLLIIGSLQNHPSRKRPVRSNAAVLREQEGWRGLQEKQILPDVEEESLEEPKDNEDLFNLHTKAPCLNNRAEGNYFATENNSDVISASAMNVVNVTNESAKLGNSNSSYDRSREFNHSNFSASTSMNRSLIENPEVINRQTKPKVRAQGVSAWPAFEIVLANTPEEKKRKKVLQPV